MKWDKASLSETKDEESQSLGPVDDERTAGARRAHRREVYREQQETTTKKEKRPDT
jgi:hypothetical protein